MKTKLFKHFFGLSLLMTFAALGAFAQSCPAPPPAFEKSALVGDWSGTYSYDGKTYNLMARISLEGEKLYAQVTASDLKLKKADFTTWVCQSNEAHLRFDLPDGKAVKMIGRPNGDILSGRFVHPEESNVCGASSNKFTMERATTKVAKAHLFKL